MQDLKINGVYRLTEELNGEVDTGEFVSDYDVEAGAEVVVIAFDDETVTTTENPQRGKEVTVFFREEFEGAAVEIG